jgi:hypothetical protein
MGVKELRDGGPSEGGDDTPSSLARVTPCSRASEEAVEYIYSDDWLGEEELEEKQPKSSPVPALANPRSRGCSWNRMSSSSREHPSLNSFSQSTSDSRSLSEMQAFGKDGRKMSDSGQIYSRNEYGTKQSRRGGQMSVFM